MVPPALFQSTLSVRRATSFDFQAKGVKNISIHALRKESDAGGPHGRVGHEISIHALRKESDFIAIDYVTGVAFQSTLSVRRAT